MKRLTWLLIIAVIVGLLTNYSVSQASSELSLAEGMNTNIGAAQEPELGPEDAAREWIDAIVNQDGNRILKYTCRAQRTKVQDTGMWISAFAVLSQLLTNRSVQIEGDISDLEFEITSQSDAQAEVRVYGELRVAVLANAQAHDVNERWQMIKENNTWRWCGSNTRTTSDFETSNIVNGLKLDVAEIREDSAEPGWKVVTIFLSAENVTDFVGYHPSGFCGILTDTGGYDRRAVSSYTLTENRQIVGVFAPKIRVKGYVIASKIPENQDPNSLVLYPSDWQSNFLTGCRNWDPPDNIQPWILTDLESPASDTVYPYDTIPTIVPTVENGILQYEEPGMYRIELSNCHFSELFACDYKFENIGGYNLRLSDRGLDDDRVVRILGATDTGRYIVDVIETGRVSPGLLETGKFTLEEYFENAPSMLYLTMVPEGRRQPVAQMIFNFMSPSPSDSESTPILQGRIAFRATNEFYMVDAYSGDLVQVSDDSTEIWQPVWRADGRQVTYMSIPDNTDAQNCQENLLSHCNWEIYVRSTDDGKIMRLTENTISDSTPILSPDGQKVAFVSIRGDPDPQNCEDNCNIDIYVINVDGTNLSRLTDNLANDIDPVWSPDGEKIAFESERDGNWEIYVINVDGTNLSRLTDNLANDIDPAWSPDGKKIAFGSERDSNWEIYVMNVDEDTQTNLTNNSTDDLMPIWSPNGQYITYASGRDGNSDIYIINANGGSPVRLTDTPDADFPVAWIPSETSIPNHSLSGTIAYPVFNGTSYDLYLGDVSTGETHFYQANASQPAFNSDGSKIAFHSWDEQSRGLHVRNVNNTDSIVIATFVEDQLPTWSADGNEIIFLSRREGDRKSRLYKVGSTQVASLGFVLGEGEYPTVGVDGQLSFRGWGNTGQGLRISNPMFDEVQTVTTSDADTAPALSPDGTQLVFMSQQVGNWEINIVNTNGTGPQRLTENPTEDGLPTWSPDGKVIAWVSNREGSWGIWVMTREGTDQRKLFEMEGSPNGFVGANSNASRGWVEERISWTQP